MSDPLFDNLVGAQQNRLRHSKAERLGGLEVDHCFVLGRHLHWEIARLRTAQNAIDMTRRRHGPPLPTTPSVQRMTVIARRMPLSDARFGFRKKIERSPPIGHVGLDLALRRAAERIGSAVHRVNGC